MFSLPGKINIVALSVPTISRKIALCIDKVYCNSFKSRFYTSFNCHLYSDNVHTFCVVLITFLFSYHLPTKHTNTTSLSVDFIAQHKDVRLENKIIFTTNNNIGSNTKFVVVKSGHVLNCSKRFLSVKFWIFPKLPVQFYSEGTEI